MTVQYLLMILKKRNDAINVFLCQMDESSKVVSMKVNVYAEDVGLILVCNEW